MSCKWDREKSDYLVDGEPCRFDSYGDPTTHCTAKKTCAHHIGANEQTCGRCLGDTRRTIRAIRDDAALLPYEALADGVNSDAAWLSAPAADYATFSARRSLDRQWLMTHIPESQLNRALKNYLEDDDAWHPFSVTTRWHWMVSADYGHQLPEVMTVSSAVEYLDRNLHRIAQDPTQDFAQLKREVEKCHKRLESVLHNSTAKPKGVPCPDCVAGGAIDPQSVRLELEYGHFCEKPDCDRINYYDEAGDKWVCPRNRLHWWTPKAYRDYIEERRTA